MLAVHCARVEHGWSDWGCHRLQCPGDCRVSSYNTGHLMSQVISIGCLLSPILPWDTKLVFFYKWTPWCRQWFDQKCISGREKKKRLNNTSIVTDSASYMHITFGKHKGQEMQITVSGQRSLKDYFALGLPLPVSGPPTQHAPLR